MSVPEAHRLTRHSVIKGAASIGLAGVVGGAWSTPALTQEADYPEMLLVATDYSFEMPESSASGFSRLTIDNQGAEDHHAMFFRLNDGVTPDQFGEALMTGDLGAVFAVSSSYGGPNVGPGGQASVIAYLDPGTYMVVCVVPDASGVPHAAHGMVSMLEVTDEVGSIEPPVADGTISLIEMAFEGLPTEVPAGSYTWEVRNDGDQLHEMVVLRLAEGVTPEMFMEMMMAEGGEGGATPVADAASATPVMMGPPFMTIGGSAPKNPGAVNYAELDLTAGDHIAICFVPDTETGVPHFVMGMVAAFTVL